MTTPILDFVRAYIKKGPLRLHMPGHKGRGPLGIEWADITEIDGADVLYHAEGIIRESEDNATALFGTARTFYSTEGSSLSIRAMLYLAMLDAKERRRSMRILAGRNAHRAFVSAVAQLDLEIDWLRDEKSSLLSCLITPERLDFALKNALVPPLAVYLTSPDYLGNTVDVRALAEVAHRYGTLLLVDNAHGAYLHFLPESRHPIAYGADMCADSAHKTLPVLTGGAYLHLSRNLSAHLLDCAEGALALFASTSPSYLILQSLDAVNLYLAEGYREKLALFSEEVASLKMRLQEKGYLLAGDEPLKLTLLPKSYGYTGEELAALLAESGIVSEFSDRDHLVLMLTPEIGTKGLTVLEHALSSIERHAPLSEEPPLLPVAERVLSLREALYAPSVSLGVQDACGLVLADASFSCPPAVPILVCGERITAEFLPVFEYYGIQKCRVVLGTAKNEK